MSAYLFQIAREKPFNYLLIIYKWQFLSRFSILRDKWRQQATSTLLDENLTCEFKRGNSFTLSKSCMKTEQFLFTVKSSLYPQLNWRTTTKQRKKSLRLSYGFLAKCFSSGCETVCKKLLNLVQVALTKYQETKLKSAKKRNFIALKDTFYLLISWFLPDLIFFTGCCTG